MSTVIKVNNGIENSLTRMSTHEYKLALRLFLGSEVEACSDIGTQGTLLQGNGFETACRLAYAKHLPLTLSPDMFWLLIVQGAAIHIKLNSEDLRYNFVNHKGKKELKVRRDDFRKGNPHNEWEEVFESFSNQIKENVGEENYDNFVAKFSTTTPEISAVYAITLMDTLQKYFSYTVSIMCGIPEIILEGEPEDWLSLIKKTVKMGDAYDLHNWLDPVLSKLGRIYQCLIEETPQDDELWTSIYKLDRMSGVPYISGWIVNFFPYVVSKRVREGYQKRERKNITSGEMPRGLSIAPFKWEFPAGYYDMEFVVGFTSVTQDPNTFAVRPKIGWAVKEAKSAKVVRS